MAGLRDYFKIVRHLWSARRQGDGSRHDTNVRTDAMLRDLGIVSQSKPLPVPPPYSDEACERLINPETDTLYPDNFQLTAQHVELLRLSRLTWAYGEGSAPGVEQERPFACANWPAYLTELLDTDDEDRHVDFLISLPAAYRTFFEEASLEPGTYPINNLTAEECAEILNANEMVPETAGLNAQGEVVLDSEIISLLPALVWEWPEEDDIDDALSRGLVLGPVVDTKRPYGDMSYFYLDIHRQLGWPVEKKNEEGYIELTDAQKAAAGALHSRSLFAAQVFLERAKWAGGNDVG